jgi:hypothetical protein
VYVKGLRSSLQSLAFSPDGGPENLLVARYIDRVLVSAGGVSPETVLKKMGE